MVTKTNFQKIDRIDMNNSRIKLIEGFSTYTLRRQMCLIGNIKVSNAYSSVYYFIMRSTNESFSMGNVTQFPLENTVAIDKYFSFCR